MEHTPDADARRGSDEQQLEMSFSAQYTRSGPLPSASELRGYGEVGSDIPDRIVTMAEEEQRFRHTAISNQQRAEVNTIERSQRYTLITVIVALMVAVILGIWGDRYVAGALGLSAIFGPTLATAFKTFSSRD